MNSKARFLLIRLLLARRAFSPIAAALFALFLIVPGGRAQTSSGTWTAGAVATGMAGRAVQTVVWTGSEMIIWGGEGNSVSYATGGRYSPALNQWTFTSQTGAPTYRSKQTAVWTGTQMIIWGGYNGSYLNDGGRYNPATDSWLPLAASGLQGRYAHLAAWTGTEMIIFGGYTGTAYVNNGAIYNPATDTWRTISTQGAPTNCAGVAAYAWTGTDLIVWGGGYHGWNDFDFRRQISSRDGHLDAHFNGRRSRWAFFIELCLDWQRDAGLGWVYRQLCFVQ